jgi:hypothetical protein
LNPLFQVNLNDNNETRDKNLEIHQDIN